MAQHHDGVLTTSLLLFMKNNRAIQKVNKSYLQELNGSSKLLKRGLEELGLLTKILKLISSGDVLKIQALDGHRNIKSSENIFRHVFSDFLDLYSDESAEKTNETEVLVYELARDADVYKMFDSFNKDFGQLCLTQDQILEFIDKYKEYKIPLDKHVIYHFLFKASGKVFYSQICVSLANPGSFPKWFDGALDEVPGTIYPANNPSDGNFRVVVPK